MSFSDKNLHHVRTRATGQLWIGPIQEVGHDNLVTHLTVSEIEFKNSVAADRFLDQMRRKYSSPAQLKRANHLRFMGRGEED
jgi:hypothetical protein